MRVPGHCLLAIVVLWSGCARNQDGRAVQSGEGGAGISSSSESGGAGRAAGAGANAAAAAGSGGTSTAGAGDCSLECETGEHCELVQVTCVRAPCPPLPMCVADASVALDCDHRKITCRRAAPECPDLQAPSVDGSCYGPCVDIHACQCTGPEACPLPESFTCNMSAKHCTPYLR